MSYDPDEYGPWIKHTQGPCPVAPKTKVVVMMCNDKTDLILDRDAEAFDWDFPADPVTKYRIKK